MRNLYVIGVVLTILLLSDGIKAQDRVDLALENLSHKDSQIRLKAAEELGQLRPQQAQVIEPLRLALSDEDHDVRSAAVLALYRIGPEAVKKAGLLGHTGYDPIASSAALDIFEQAWSIFNTEYPMFVIREQLDWDALRDRYLVKARTAKSVQELAIIITQMLRHLQDGHVWLKLKGKNLPVFKLPAELNVNTNTKIYGRFLGRIQSAGRQLMWAKTKDKIGWIMFPHWHGADLPDRFDEVMEQMRDTRALIVDVRWNGGGDAELSKYIAARFADKTRVYSHYQYRNGPQLADLTKKIAQTISPRGPWTYDRPVILLMGQGCVSACESFCAMMAACPRVTTMGDHTRGSTGFPVPFKLGQEIEVHVPQWIVTLPNGKGVDGQGVIPDIPFTAKPDSFTGDREDLLTLALEQLRREPLPSKAIQGPTIQALRKREKANKNDRPRLVSVNPKEGTRSVAPNTELRLRFDRPMHPSTLQLEWQEGGFHSCASIHYDAGKYEFTIPIQLAAGCQQRITVNPPDPGVQKGFQSAQNTEAESYTWTFSTLNRSREKNSDEPSPASTDAANTQKARSIVEQFNETRRGMRAFVETIKTQAYDRSGPHGYQHLRAYETRFTLNGKRELCADVGEKRGMPLIVFNEGHLNHISGYYRKNLSGEEIVFCLDADVTERRIMLADPFRAQSPDVDATLRQLDLQYGGEEASKGKTYDIICTDKHGGTAPGSARRLWWIDQQSHLLSKMVTLQGKQAKTVSFLSYKHINEDLNFMAYMPDISYKWVCANKHMVPPLSKDSHRFIEMNDGTSGSVAVQWGKRGVQGSESIGL
jgi:hypothetical protein